VPPSRPLPPRSDPSRIPSPPVTRITTNRRGDLPSICGFCSCTSTACALRPFWVHSASQDTRRAESTNSGDHSGSCLTPGDLTRIQHFPPTPGTPKPRHRSHFSSSAASCAHRISPLPLILSGTRGANVAFLPTRSYSEPRRAYLQPLLQFAISSLPPTDHFAADYQGAGPLRTLSSSARRIKTCSRKCAF